MNTYEDFLRKISMDDRMDETIALFKMLSGDLLDISNRVCAINMIQDAEKMKPVSIPCSVFIQSDRHYPEALSLQYILQTYSDAVVAGTSYNEKDARFLLRTVTPNILIFIGYQKDTQNYCLIEELRKRNPSTLVVMWAILDCLINEHCQQNNIRLCFDRRRSVLEFLDYLSKLSSKVKH